jgi:DNA-binding NtrC family response regulator
MSEEPRKKLLIVDDEPDMLDFLERVLRRRFDVHRTSSAEDALALLRAGEFEVLVTDQKMPRVTGLELLARLGDRCPNLVKVLISGYTEVPDIERAVDQGRIHNYVLKPVDGERLVEAIDEAYAVRDGRRRPSTNTDM